MLDRTLIVARGSKRTDDGVVLLALDAHLDVLYAEVHLDVVHLEVCEVVRLLLARLKVDFGPHAL